MINYMNYQFSKYFLMVKCYFTNLKYTFKNFSRREINLFMQKIFLQTKFTKINLYIIDILFLKIQSSNLLYSCKNMNKLY